MSLPSFPPSRNTANSASRRQKITSMGPKFSVNMNTSIFIRILQPSLTDRLDSERCAQFCDVCNVYSIPFKRISSYGTVRPAIAIVLGSSFFLT